ncbi:stage V sporulation protein AF [Alkalithermobacter thermoalcaliphilus JW-YL-7 = DSM 7308]|uniref:GerA spore germination protein n=1 Tax=Alkalithermobacter thermoalcaliphilus JW-YL-7 = DSM 7308 TaxID=1121328 RepID=A0A150FP29_CLOPD|nr:GerA spore germination protein [[Clostridium] paradoxum JW-YL-7 = DSM 7308]SHK53462.1 stage V sporulation protein AF [[Clostridium] paradoxum JW-YL-7 = DSM 7308]
MKILSDINENKKILKSRIPIDQSFDVIGREIKVGNKDCYLVFIDGFAKDDIMLWILETLQSMETVGNINFIKKLLSRKIGYIEVETFDDFETLEDSVLSGAVALILDKENEGLIIDAREYPVRGPEEPDLEKVTRGSRDGLVETIVFNTALIRRRIRDTNLVFEMKSVGKRSKTDVVVGYIKDLADNKLVDDIKQKLDSVDVDSLIMAEKTLDELIIKKKWYNPLPQVKFTERPDVVSAHLLEGHVAIIVDTSPSVMLLPATLFHFTQHAEDYYQNPLVGTYLRWVRFFGILLSFVLLPLWLLLVYNKSILPESLSFLGPKETGVIPLFLQFIILELGIDLLRIASIHTPNSLSTSLGIVGGLILSEFAIKVGWFVPETVLYMAIVSLGTFATPSIEFSMAIRIFRLFLLICTGLFKLYGFIVALSIVGIIIFKTKSFNNKSYLWPLIPLDIKSLSNVLFRKPIPEIKKHK